MNLTFSALQKNPGILEKLFKASTAVACDFEFPGIEPSPPRNPYLMEAAYMNSSSSVKRYVPLQLGLCFNTENQGLVPLKIYLDPIQNSPDQAFKRQTIQFLLENNFDFNRIMKDAVRFCSHREILISSEQRKLRQLLSDSLTLSPSETKKFKVYASDYLQHNIINRYTPDSSFSIKLTKYPEVREMLHPFLISQISDLSDFIVREAKSHCHYLKPGKNSLVFSDMELFNLGSILHYCVEKYKRPMIFHNGFLDILYVCSLASTLLFRASSSIHGAFPKKVYKISASVL